MFSDMDTDLIPAASQCTSPLNLSLAESGSTLTLVKSDQDSMEVNVSAPCTSSLLVQQPTIILTTNSLQPSKLDRLVLPKMNIKVEPQEFIASSPEHSSYCDSIDLPPTPPSSTNSDSEGSSSPQRSAPCSPMRQSLRHETLHSLSSPPAALFSSPVSCYAIAVYRAG